MKTPRTTKPTRQHGGGSSNKDHGGSKLPSLPKGSKIHKRPLAHRIGASPARTVYVSSKAPFMSIIKRVRKKMDHDAGGAKLSSTRGLPLLAQVENLHVGSGTASKKQSASAGSSGAEATPAAGEAANTTARENEKHEVKVLATGKAIEKALEVAAWFARQPDCAVAIRSGSVSTVDEVELPPDSRTLCGDAAAKRIGAKTSKDADGDLEMDEEAEQGDEELDPYRMRMVAYVEVGVRYRTY